MKTVTLVLTGIALVVSAWALGRAALDKGPRLSGTAESAAAGRTIHVNIDDPAASDRNPGTASLPAKTIGRAVEMLVADNARGRPVTVSISPGTYRETVSLPAGGTGAPITFEATRTGGAVISGSDIWKGWTRRDDRGVYTHPWPNVWGLVSLPEGWRAVPDIVRRREMVYVNGKLLKQILSVDELQPGTFYIDEEAHLLYIFPQPGIIPDAAAVEVAVRDPLFKAHSRANVTIRGLVFEHAATPLDAAAVRVAEMQRFTVEDVTFRWNNWDGLGFSNSADVFVRRSISVHNGARGMSDWKNRNVLFEDTETSYNNWRGAWGGWHAWAAAGIKNMLLHGGVFRHHRSVGNATYGFWLDTDNRDVRVDGGFWCDNVAGAFVEASQGPITIARTTICKNASTGLLTSTSGRVTVRDSVLYGNGDDGQFATNNELSETIQDWETGQKLVLRTEHWTFCGDAFVASKRGQALLSLPSWDFFQRTLSATQNVYWNPVQPDAFWVRAPSTGGRALDLLAWRRASGQDGNSVFADPKFADPEQGDFTPLPSSPWRTCR